MPKTIAAAGATAGDVKSLGCLLETKQPCYSCLQGVTGCRREGRSKMRCREVEDEARLSALREAAEVGIADIEAGRFRVFETADELREYLCAIAAEALADEARFRS